MRMRVLASGFEQRQQARQDARDGTVADAEQEAETSLVGYWRNQITVSRIWLLRRQIGVPTAAAARRRSARCKRVCSASHDRGSMSSSSSQLVQAQAGHLQKHGWVPAQLVVATDHQRPRQWAWRSQLPTVYPTFSLL